MTTENETPNEDEQTQPSEQKPTRTRKPKDEKPATEESRDPFGQSVYYMTGSETIRPAIVTAVDEDGLVDLTVFNSQGAMPATRVKYADPLDEVPHSWHWPSED